MEIRYYETSSGRKPAQEYINSLPEADRAGITGDIELIQEMGIINAPVVTRKLQGKQFKGKLWELKSGTGHQQRIFYILKTGPLMLLLHACKKQKEGAQRRDLDVALKRMKEVL
jgi:phage-related protein